MICRWYQFQTFNTVGEKRLPFILLFAGSKTPTSKFGWSTKKLGGSRAARKSPISSTNNQWRMNKTPTD
ncbi:hypothetical protein COD67_21895 [Bacillus cereus]|nr:hypothetical protein COI89_02765 [Bacillus cereus]PGU62996.1 hypothetical protein COD67_21895 [Bacillus cereus]